MVVIDYEAPVSLEEAIRLLIECKDKPAKVMAGGTDLIIQLRSQVQNPHLVIDLKKIPGMTGASISDQGALIGPAMNCAELTARDDIRSLFPGFIEAANLIGSTQVQGRASVGGNLCNSSPAADTIPALFVVNAQCQIQGPAGTRTVPVTEFVTGVGENCLARGEILTKILLPLPQAGTADAYLRFIPRTEMDIAVAGAGVSVTLAKDGTCTAARVAIGAVATTALLVPEAAEALIGSKLDEAALKAAAASASEASRPIDDRRGTIEFRKHVVGVLTSRAAVIAAGRAKEKLNV